MNWTSTDPKATNAIENWIALTNSAFLYVDADGLIRAWNTAFLELFQIDEDLLYLTPHFSTFSLYAMDKLGIEEIDLNISQILIIQIQQNSIELQIQIQKDGAILCHYEKISNLITENLRLKEDFLALQKAMDQLSDEGVTDRLTQTWNRKYFDKIMPVELSRTQRLGLRLCVMILDIDHFKSINDHHGHPVGDAVLQDLCKVLRSQLRETDTLIRWGGEEFVVIASATDKYSGRIVAEKLRHAIETHRFPEVKHVTISIGISEYIYGEAIEDSIHRADLCLYQAKEGGRNRFVVDQDLLKVDHEGRIHLDEIQLLEHPSALMVKEHQSMVEEILKLIQCHNLSLSQHSKLGPIVRLLRITEEHFFTEERIQRSLKYPQAAWHQNVHKHLYETADSLYRQVLEERIDLIPFVDFFVSQIIMGHLYCMDLAFEKWRTEQIPNAEFPTLDPMP